MHWFSKLLPLVRTRNFRRTTRSFLLSTTIVVGLTPQPLIAATYYVDFVAGNDSNAGTNTSTAWKHSPGDNSAVGVPATKTLAAGDKVIFKGGSVYRGTINLKWSGSSTSPIIYDGNSANTWGTGKAIMDGTDPWNPSWTRCTSAADCRGNPNYTNIYYTTIPTGVTSPFHLFLYNNGSDQLYIAQDPNPSNRAFIDVLTEWRSVPASNISATQVTDSTYLTQASSSFYTDARIGYWAQGNALIWKPILSFDPSNDRLTFESGQGTPYTDRTCYYTIVGLVNHIDRAGELALSKGENRLYLWPPNSADPATLAITQSKRSRAFYGNSQGNFTITNFEIRGYWADDEAASYEGTAVTVVASNPRSGQTKNISVTNCDIHDLRSMERDWALVLGHDSGRIITGNTFRRSFGGAVYVGHGSDLRVEDNQIHELTRTAIYCAEASGASIARNSVIDVIGIHSNGISVYSNSSNVSVSYNILKNILTPITYEYSSNLDFIGNLVDGAGKDQHVNEWGGCSGTIRWINNTLINASNSLMLNIGNGGVDTTYEIRNNIIHGGGPPASAPNVVRTHNIYTILAFNQTAQYNWALGTNERQVTNLTQLFSNPSASDWRLVAGSPAINAGYPVGSSVLSDLLGTTRTSYGAIDIGAYEFVGSSGGSAPNAPSNLSGNPAN